MDAEQSGIWHASTSYIGGDARYGRIAFNCMSADEILDIDCRNRYDERVCGTPLSACLMTPTREMRVASKGNGHRLTCSGIGDLVTMGVE